ncbi:MAG: GxxExxY protein [Chromatiales bacterium]|nr:GxxExxY protein [Chromatiales bacterium]
MRDLNEISGTVLDSAIEVHRTLGPGLLESVYAQALELELGLRGLEVRREVPLAANYKGKTFDAAYRLDLLVENGVIVELKVVEQLLAVHKAQLLSYLKLSGLSLGLLINFNVPKLKDGVKRVVNNL